jgi:hypothetical protein
MPQVISSPAVQPHILLGRSGTGKTTVILHRMQKLLQESGGSPPQIAFVAANKNLVNRVQEYFGKESTTAADAETGTQSFFSMQELLLSVDAALSSPFFSEGQQPESLGFFEASKADLTVGTQSKRLLGSMVDWTTFQNHFW